MHPRRQLTAWLNQRREPFNMLPLSLPEVLEEELEQLGHPLPGGEYRTWLLCRSHVKDARALILKLTAHDRGDGHAGVSKFIFEECLSENLRTLLTEYASSYPDDAPWGPDDSLLNALITELNDGVLRERNAGRQPLYTDQRFCDVPLPNDVRQLTKLNLAEDALLQRNRRLLDEVYPAELQSRLALDYAYIHRALPNSSALALSGGGIRSATFGLGVLQGLARCDLLDKFDYLSTVSGGGYIGSWLSAWIYNHPRGLPGVVNELSEHGRAPLEPEPQPVSHLRQYSHFLTPQAGALSADTWSVLANIVRNVLLNWLVLVPLLFFIAAMPRLYVGAAGWSRSRGTDAAWSTAPGWAILAAMLLGTLLAGCSVAYVSRNLPTGKPADAEEGAPAESRQLAPRWFEFRCTSQGKFLSYGLAPILLATLLLSLAWSWNFGARQVPWVATSRPHYVLGFLAHGASLNTAHLFLAITGCGLVMGALGSIYLRQLFQVPSSIRQVDPSLFVISLGILGLGIVAGAALLAFLLLPRDFLNPVAHPGLYAVVAPSLFLGLFLLAVSFFTGVASYWTDDDAREWLARSTAWILIAMVLWAGLSLLVIYGPVWLLNLPRWAKPLVALFGTASGIFSALAARSSKTPAASGPEAQAGNRSSLLDYGLKLAAPIFAVFLLIVVSLAMSMALQSVSVANLGGEDLGLAHARLPADHFVHQWVVERTPIWVIVPLALILLTASLLAARFISVNKFSMHATYRNRLTRAYLGASRAARTPNLFTGFDDRDNIPMQQLWPKRYAGTTVAAREAARQRHQLLHVICCTLNLVGGKNLAWQERKAESFTVSALHAGSYNLGYRRTEYPRDEYLVPPDRPPVRYGGFDGISLGTAMTISGAAVSPNMGYHSSPAITLLMTLFNVRLGWWLGNPGVAGARRFMRPSPAFSFWPLVNEALGQTNDENPYVYLSDGGHFENLGLYEMVLRRCHTIVISDASGDPSYRFEDLGNAIRKLRVDLGISITFDHDIQIEMRDGKLSPKYAAVGTIHYEEVDGQQARPGRLVLLKAAVCEDAPKDITNYARTNPSFPQDSTLNQFYNESQFESYRALGAHLIAAIYDCQSPDGDLDHFVCEVGKYAAAPPKSG